MTSSLPSPSSITAWSNPAAFAVRIARVELAYRAEALASVGAMSGPGRRSVDRQAEKPVNGGSGPQLKSGASDVLWEGGTSYAFAKWLEGEIENIYAKHNCKRAVVPIDTKKPANESEAAREIRSYLLKVGIGGVFAKRMIANNGDIAHHASTAAVHQAAGAAARL